MDDGSNRPHRRDRLRASRRATPPVRWRPARPCPQGWTGKGPRLPGSRDAARGTHLFFVDSDVAPRAPAPPLARGAPARDGAGPLQRGAAAGFYDDVGELLSVPMINFLMPGLPAGTDHAHPPRPRGLGAAAGRRCCSSARPTMRSAARILIRSPPARRHPARPARMRDHGRMTDVVLGSELATCRMYETLDQAWGGLPRQERHEGHGVLGPAAGLDRAARLRPRAAADPGCCSRFSAQARLPLALDGARAVARPAPSPSPARPARAGGRLPLHPATVAVGGSRSNGPRCWGLGRGRAGGWKGRAPIRQN